MNIQYFADGSMMINGISVESLPVGSVVRFETYGGEEESYNTMIIEIPTEGV